MYNLTIKLIIINNQFILNINSITKYKNLMYYTMIMNIQVKNQVPSDPNIVHVVIIIKCLFICNWCNTNVILNNWIENVTYHTLLSLQANNKQNVSGQLATTYLRS